MNLTGPLDWTFSPSQYCLDGAPKSGLQSSVCCLEVITSLSQALASNCNRTGALLLTEVDATACANMASDNRWTDNKTCTISPVLTALADNSLCHFAHLQDLKTTLGNANFHNVTAYCQGVQENSCSDCQFAFNQSQTLLTKQTGGEVGSSDMDCRFALLVAIASLDIQNSQSTQALYECVKSKCTSMIFPSRALAELYLLLVLNSLILDVSVIKTLLWNCE